MSEKLVRKWLLDDIADIDRNESWLSDLAEEGLFLAHLGRFAYFKRDTPRAMRYRFDVLSRMLTEDELGVYDACGWHFVTLYNELTLGADVIYYVFTTDENATVPELHTDPMEQAASLKHLHRQSTANLVLMTAATLFTVGLQIYSMFFASPEARFRTLVYGNGMLFYPILYLIYIWQGVRRYLAVRRLRKRLSGGQMLDHHAPYRTTHRRGKILNTVCWMFTAGMILAWLAILLGYLGGSGDGRTAPEELNFPAVRLAEVETSNDFELWGDGLWYHEWTSACTVQDDLYEKGCTTGKKAKVTLSTSCYRLPFAFESGAVLEGAMAQAKHYYTQEPHLLETDLVDEAWTAEASREENEQYLFARSGRYVFQIRYHNGSRNVAELLPLLAEKLNG